MTPSRDELRHAIDRDELMLLFHPQVEIATGTPVGAEAVLRWRHPERGLLHAMEFVGQVPPYGLERDAMRWIIRAAARQVAQWRASGIGLDRVAINTWPESLRADLVDDILAAAADARIPASAIEVETPPEAVYDPATLSTIRALHDAGVRTALDDFGDGDLRFAWLRDAVFDVVKVPVTFVRDPGTQFDAAVIHAAVAFAQTLGAVTVAEGVETVAARDRVRALGCDIGQGYLWSRIVEGHDVARALAAIIPDGAR